MTEEKKDQPTQEELDEAANDELWMFPHDGFDYSPYVRKVGGGIFYELVFFFILNKTPVFILFFMFSPEDRFQIHLQQKLILCY